MMQLLKDIDIWRLKLVMNNYFIIRDKLPSLNEYQDACRSNKYSGAKIKEQVEYIISINIKASKIKGTLKAPTKFPLTLNIYWHEKDKRRDVDNIKSAAKFILDAMVKTGIIPDDGRKYIKQIHDTIVDEPTKQTFVVVEIIEEGSEQ